MIDIETMSILIVDDMKSMRSIMKKTLRHLNIGGQIYFAENGVEGMKCLQEKKVDLAIVDWRMPVMNGAQMLDAIRSDTAYRDMPVLMVTAESERDIVYEVAEIEVDGYLLKPLTPAMLEDKIQWAVDRANAPDEATLMVRKARELDEAGKPKAALRFQEKAVAIKPNASRLKRNLGIYHGKAGDTKTMEKCFLEATAANPQDAVTRQLLAKLYWKQEKWHQSVRFMCQALSLTNRFNEYALTRGKQLITMEMESLAVTLFNKLLGKLERNLAMKEEILDLCVQSGALRFSRHLVLRLIRDFPTNHGLLYKAGQVFEALEEYEKALDYYLEADRNMIRPVDTKLKIARLYFKGDKVLQADDFLTQVLRIEPDNEAALELRRSF